MNDIELEKKQHTESERKIKVDHTKLNLNPIKVF